MANELLEGFLAQYDNEDGVLSLKDLMTEEEIDDWELLVKVFNELEISELGPNLKKVAKQYNLNRWQEMSVLAIVKMLEMMVANAKMRMGDIDKMVKGIKQPPRDKTQFKFDSGGMFG